MESFHERIVDDSQSLTLQFTTELIKLLNERSANSDTPIGLSVPPHLWLHQHTERFLQYREKFRRAGKPINITTAFHYTSSKNAEGILQDGFICGQKTRHGTRFGQGVYVATNPLAFSCYGSVGMLLMIMHGTSRQLTFYEKSTEFQADSFLGNKLTETSGKNHFFPRTTYFDEIILRDGRQALVVAMYPQGMVNNHELLYDLQVRLQRLADRLFHGGRQTPMRPVIPSYEDLVFQHDLRIRFKAMQRRWPMNGSHNFVFQYQPNEPNYGVVLVSHSNQPLGRGGSYHFPVVQCLSPDILYCLDGRTKGPIGPCPEGSMAIIWDGHRHCDGYQHCGTFMLTYTIPAGKQSLCHHFPGKSFTGTKRVAFVPGDFHGRDGGYHLVKRLRSAFMNGLVFDVGTSLTTGKANQVVWASITHKSKQTRNIHGFPDPNFFTKCNTELDSLGVPQAGDLPSLQTSP